LGWRGAAPALLATLLLAGCGSLPQHVERPYSAAMNPSPESPLVRITHVSIPGPELSGFRLMPLGVYSLDARVQLARRARYSLDVQYYLIQNDKTGRLLLRNLRDGPDGQRLEWLTMDDEGEVVLSTEPDTTFLLRLQNVLFSPFVPEQQL
jgi:cardiolipin synthase C